MFKYILGDHYCKVGEGPYAQVVKKCKCENYASQACQLLLNTETLSIKCLQDTNKECQSAVRFWALAYRNSRNANSTICRYVDPSYKLSQDAWSSCSAGKKSKYNVLMAFNEVIINQI